MSSKSLHVAVGIIRNELEEVLIALRDKRQHQGGLWEFPGGKVEAGESVSMALSRELQEELGLQVLSSSPLLKVEHDYGDKQVLLDVWQVDSFQGKATGKEGQPICWVGLKELKNYQFPQANHEIIHFLLES
ncbi:MAG: 8-oxo-dGTP diphosphatase MutT [SAR86 cluster bacterium]|uniref:8-oxo-dGTP diphosphatase n=1 Tax=SAR86 cluster bacterium TaxID=2030880 RepID=A0A2A5CAR9_9GAMM|nr:MAG: 8-oxo-dGTP diphosphatase MutT [SAR86 cluster bacterium]